MALIDSLVVFLIGLLVGGAGIYVGGRLVAGVTDYSHAVITAFIGALAWAVIGFLLGGVPGVAPIVALVAWIWIINSRYPGGWLKAILIGLTSWLTVILILSILASLGIGNFDAVGVPQ
jgi:hypothetical protein